MRKLTSIALCIIMMVALVLSASALELDAAEGAANETAVLAGDTIDIPLVDAEYGKLILYKDFEQENATNKSYAYLDTNYMTGTSVKHGGTSSKVVANPVEGKSGNVLEVTGTSWAQFFVTFSDLYVKPGTYMVVYEYYSNTNCGDFMERYFTNINHSGGTGAGDYLSLYPGKAVFNTGEWITRNFNALTAKSLSDETGTGFTITYGEKSKPYYNTDAANVKFSQIGVMPNATSITYYLDNIKLYYFPENAVIYKHGESYELVEYENGVVTMPTLSEVDETWTLDNFRVWTDGTNFYLPGKTYSCADMTEKTLTPMAFEKELYDETKGELAILFAFDGKTSKTAPTFLNPEYFPEKPSISIRSDGVESYDLADDTDGNKVMKVTVNKTGTYLFGYYWWNNIASAPQRVTLDYDMKIVSGEAGLSGKSYRVRFSNFGDPNDPANNNSSEKYDWGNSQEFDATLNKWVSYSTCINNPASRIGTYGAIPQVGSDSAYDIVMYHDNIAIYVKPSSVTFYAEEGGEAVETIVFKGTSSELTFPNPSDLGLAATDFVAWTDGEDYYKAGETIPYTNADNPYVKEFYPFYQSADVPAVISLLDGTEDISVSKTNYDEKVEDDGRDAIHIHYWGTTWTDSYNKWLGDPRTMVKCEKFDASQYGVVELMVKSPMCYQAKEETNKECNEYIVREKFDVNIYYCYNESYSFSGHTIHQFIDIPVDDEYHLVTVDMKDKPNATYPWENTGWGMAVDVNTGSYAADTYIDYLRVYRWGATTVTYDTNAPDGVEDEDILAEVDPETGRGLGTGYLLTGLRPEIEGYVFKGWATSEDSTETVESIDLTGDTTVYAVWDAAEKYITAEMLEDMEIKGTAGENNGIRFKSQIKSSIKANLDEFGFLATREVLLPLDDEGNRDYNALVFEHKVNGADKCYYVQGVAYDKDGGIDAVNSEKSDGGIVYTAVLSGIPLANKEEVMVVRPYAQYEINGNAVTIYGTPASGSLYKVAESIKKANGDAYINNQAYIDTIVPDAQ